MPIYRLLLSLFCPASFRNEYGSEMQAVFQKRMGESSAFGAIWTWLDAIADIAVAGISSHWDLLLQDLRYAWRSAGRAPAFTAVVIGVAALGVAATTAVFTIADHILLRPLPFPKPQELVKLWEDRTVIGYSRLDVSPANYRDWKRMNTSFEAIASYRDLAFNLSGAGDPVRVVASAVNYELFPILGISPALGRNFAESEDRAGAARTAILSYNFWQSSFGADPNIAGRVIQLDGQPATIIGVMPADFNFPRRDVRLWTAQRFDESDYQDRDNHALRVVGRLKPGRTIQQARAEMRVVASSLERQYPDNKDVGVTVISMRDELPSRSVTIVKVLACGAGFLLLIACSNLANLILARSAARRKELEVRTALGAGRERLVRQMLTESAILSLLGGSLGLAMAHAAIPVLSRLAPTALPIAETPAMDWRVLLFALTMTLATGIFVGILPALRSTRAASLGLRAGSTGGKDSVRRMLVIAQVAASLALVVSTGLLLRALTHLLESKPGFTAGGKTLTFRTALQFPKYMNTATRERYYESVLAELRALPGVQNAAVTSFRPMGDFRGGIWPVRLPGETRDTQACSRFITPGYFQAMGIPLLRGRDLLPSDGAGSLPVAVVSESFVAEHWPGESGVGRVFEVKIGNRKFTIVGVVAHVRVRGFEMQSEPQMYLASAQMLDRWFEWFTPKDFIVGSSLADPRTLLPAVRKIVAAADPVQPISDVQTFDEILEADTAARRVQLWIIGAFAVAAFLLAGVGIHGLLSFGVTQRTPEIGLRRALGARTAQIAAMVFGEALALSGLGAVAGLALAYAVARSMEAFLAGVPAADGLTMAASAGVALLMTLGGTLAPAWRAMRVDPAISLRTE